MKHTKEKLPYTIIAIVILPEPIHAIWKLPEGDANFPGRWRLIKSYFTQNLLKEGCKILKDNRGGYKVWQNRYWEHTIRNDNDLESHIEYIHYNLVKHGLGSLSL